MEALIENDNVISIDGFQEKLDTLKDKLSTLDTGEAGC